MFIRRAVLALLAVALIIVGYLSFKNVAQFQRLGERSIANSTLWLAQAKVKRLEEQIIKSDQEIFRAIEQQEVRHLERVWQEPLGEHSASVHDVAVLDSDGEIIGFTSRADRSQRWRFRRLLKKRVVPDLALPGLRLDRLYHLHRTYGDRSYLISYKAIRRQGRRMYLIAHHDTRYLLHHVLPPVLTSESGNEWLNVVDENNRRVFGQSLREAGDYVVGYRFPTTLYAWRLQIAPTAAPLLEAQVRSSRFIQAALIFLSLFVIFGAVVYSLFTADQQRRLAGLKSDFIANVSHELKTPLSVIRMFAEMLLTKRVADKNKEEAYLETICRESERLSNLIQNVLDFAALERGKQHYELEVGDVLIVVQRALDTFRYRLEQLGAQLTLQVKGDTFLSRMDEQSILLSVINLVDNAAKYGEGTEVTVTVDGTGEELRIEVRDRGPGIPEEDLKRVFERFYRTGTRSTVRGSGIGLSLVNHTANAHHGRAWAENAEGGGARVILALPRYRAPDSEASAAHPDFDSMKGLDMVDIHHG